MLVNKFSCLPFLIVALASVVSPAFGADYTSTQSGDWDDTNTWGAAGFPASGDTATITNACVVSIKGAEACGTVTVNVGGTLRFDGQINTVVAKLTLDAGATLANSGTVDQTGTGSAGYAYLSGTSLEPMTGNQPTFGNGYWYVGQIDFQMDIITGGGGCVIKLAADIQVDAVTQSGATDYIRSSSLANTIKADGDWDGSLVTSYAWEFNFQALSDLNLKTGSINNRFYNFTVDAGATVTLQSHGSSGNTATINGTLNGANTYGWTFGYIGASATALVMGGSGDISSLVYMFVYTSNNTTIDGFTCNGYGYWYGNADNVTYTLNGDIIFGGRLLVYRNSTTAWTKLDTAGHNVTIGGDLDIGYTRWGVLVCNDSVIDVGDNFLCSQYSSVDFGSSTWTVGGGWTNSGTVACGTSTVAFTNAASVDNNHQAFYNLTSDAGAGTVTLAAGEVSAVSNLLWVKSGTCHTVDKVDKKPTGAGTWTRMTGGINVITCGLRPQIDPGATLEADYWPPPSTIFTFY